MWLGSLHRRGRHARPPGPLPCSLLSFGLRPCKWHSVRVLVRPPPATRLPLTPSTWWLLLECGWAEYTMQVCDSCGREYVGHTTRVPQGYEAWACRSVDRGTLGCTVPVANCFIRPATPTTSPSTKVATTTTTTTFPDSKEKPVLPGLEACRWMGLRLMCDPRMKRFFF
eukprot:gene23765-biopygen17849